MKLFTVGPVQKFESTLEVSKVQEPYFRNEEFSKLMLENEAHIKRLVGADSDARVCFLACSGSGAMECAVLNAFDTNDKVLVVNGGSFGKRFCDILQRYEIPHIAIKYQDMEKFDAKGYTGFCVNVHETSTGELYDYKKIGEFCKKNKLRLVVDIISTFLADEFDFEKSGADFAVLSSQKALALNCGMSAVVIRGGVSFKKVKSLYFDLNEYLKSGVRGQTPFTCTVAILYQLHDRIKNLKQSGEIKRCAELAKLFRKEIKCEIPKYTLSNALTPIYVNNAMALYKKLKEIYGFEVTPCGGEMAEKMLRVGHLGNLTTKDIADVARAINECI
jgi:aspartate aminotransferase-like enzyme